MHEAPKQSQTDEIGKLHDKIQMRCLQQHLTPKSGKIDDAGDKNVTYFRKIFINTDAGTECSLT